MKLSAGLRALHPSAMQLRVTCDCCARLATCELGDFPMYFCDAHKNVDADGYRGGFFAKYKLPVSARDLAVLSAAREVRP